MDQNNVNMGGQMNPSSNSGGSAGPIIGVVVILAIIVLGGLYFWKERNAMAPEATENASIESIKNQSESDDAASIEADLDATDVENIDAELNTY